MATVVIKNVSTNSEYVRDLQDTVDANEQVTITRSLGELTSMTALNTLVTNGSFQVVSLTVDPTEASWVAAGAPIVQPADVTLDVRTTTGSDSLGNGTPTRPFATIMKAVDYIGHLEGAVVTIRVFGGTYAETVRDGHMYRDNGLFTAQILVQAQDFATPTLGSGSITAGVLGNAPAAGITRTVAGAAWTVNELKGIFALITSGTLAGSKYPIMANAAGSLDIPSTSASLNGASFNLVKQSCILTRSPNVFASAIIGNGGSATTATAMQLQGFKISSGSFYGVYFASGQGSVTECLIQGHTFAGINLGTPITVAAASRTYIGNGAGQTGITGGAVAQFFGGALGIDGGSNGIQLNAAARVGTNSSGHIVIQNATTTGFEFKTGVMDFETFSTQKIIVRNSAVGFQAQGGGHYLFQGCEFTNNTSHGIRILANNTATAHNSLHMFGNKIQNNGGDGIRVESPHNNIMFGSGDISGNSGFGVNIGGQPAGYPAASHNSLTFDSGVTMSANTAGDVTNDNGSTTKTIAQLRIDGFDVDANLFNRVQAS